MRVKWILTSMLCVLLALAVPGSLRPGLAQEPDPQGTLAAQGSVGAAAAALVGTAFTYQGRLTDGGSPANGKYDFLFRLYDSDETQVGSTVTKGDVDVADGTFTVSLDFGSAFNGDARYLDVSVRPGSSTAGGSSYTNRFYVGSLPYSGNSVYEKLLVTVWGGQLVQHHPGPGRLLHLVAGWIKGHPDPAVRGHLHVLAKGLRQWQCLRRGR